jgi:hypothetical protein
MVAIIGDEASAAAAAMPRVQLRLAGLSKCAMSAAEARDAKPGDDKAPRRCMLLRADPGNPVRVETRAAVLAALEQARAGLSAATDEDWGRRARTEALALIDAQIARMKAGQ